MATTIISVSALAHLAVGGQMLPSVGRFVALYGVAILVAIRLSDVEWTYARLVVALGSAQLVIHAALAVRWADPTAFPIGAHGGLPASHVVMPEMAGNLSPSTASLMVYAHAAAVLLLSLLLRHGEKWAFGLRDRIVAAVSRRRRRLLQLPLASEVRPHISAPRAAFVDASQIILGCVVRRGPPATFLGL